MTEYSILTKNVDKKSILSPKAERPDEDDDSQTCVEFNTPVVMWKRREVVMNHSLFKCRRAGGGC